MADRKSSDNDLKTNLVDNDLFDVLDSETGVASEKNKSITKGDLFTQIANELALTGSPVNTNITTGFETGYAGIIRFYKISKFVFFNMTITVSGPSTIGVYGGLSSSLIPINDVYVRVNGSSGASDSKLNINTFGNINLAREGTISGVVAAAVYSASGFYMTN